MMLYNGSLIYIQTCLHFAGDLTVEVAKKFAPRYIIGIDMDDDLVGKANSRVRNLALHSKATFMVPRALATGQLKESKKGMDLFPKNVKFVCWDIMNDDEKGYALGDMEYDTIMCMSVVKWIHLNNGDEGLIKFFRRLHGLCILGVGSLLLNTPHPFIVFVN